MKKLLIIFPLIFSVCSKAQIDSTEVETDSIEIKYVVLPDSTDIGAPDGKPVSKEIGTAGGKIISDDGRVELIFAEGALSINTVISIQPIVNLMPNGNGKAYQFAPSGIQFKKPVQIIFHYTDQEAETCPPDLKFMALQNHKGKWEYLYYKDWDRSTKSLKGFISHFSAFVDGNELELSSTEITLKVGKSHSFTLNVVQPPGSYTSPGEDELPPLPITMQRGNREVLWKVNETTGGSTKHGRIIPKRGKAIIANYTSPAALTTDPVNVKLELNDVIIEQIRRRIGRRGWIIGTVRRTSNVATFTCKVTLFAEYKVSVIFKMKEGHTELVDSANFIATIFPHKVELSDIQNYPPSAKMSNPPQCEAKIIIDEFCVGIVNIASGDIYNYKASNDSPPKIIWKVRSKQNLVYKFQYVCKRNTSPVENTELDSYPHEISFIANGQRQTINYDQQWFKIIVTPVREE